MERKNSILLGKIGFGFLIGFTVIIFVESVLSLLSIFPQVNTNPIDILYPITFWVKIIIPFIATVILLISFIGMKKSLVDPNSKNTLKIMRNITIGLVVIVPLSVIYYVYAGVGAWGDMVVAGYLFTAGNIVLQVLLQLPIFIWFYRVKKVHSHTLERKININLLILNLVFCSIFIVGYLFSMIIQFQIVENTPISDVLYLSIVYTLSTIYIVISILLKIHAIRNFSNLERL
ncbi:MAG: hypothetical protein EU530_00540 [Promethearchaeota archaeon]|nr:MAG: hypothetical protein EU530_00540 [Candidatus Lokiarchaeota archaeon]